MLRGENKSYFLSTHTLVKGQEATHTASTYATHHPRGVPRCAAAAGVCALTRGWPVPGVARYPPLCPGVAHSHKLPARRRTLLPTLPRRAHSSNLVIV